MQQGSSYRDITIVYAGIYLPCQVHTQKIVSEYFKQQFRIQHNQRFRQAATYQITKYKQLIELKQYDVRLNSIKPEHSVRDAKLYFSSYNRDKRLYFYVIDEQQQQNNNKSPNNDYFVQFQLIIGGSIQKSRSLNIKNISYAQLVSNLKHIFQIDPTQPIQLINSQTNTALSFDLLDLPQRKLRALNLSRVGVKRVFTAG